MVRGRRHLKNPNTNTALAVFGGASLVFRELLGANAFGLREASRGLIGSNVADFNSRLLHVALGSCALAAFCTFE